MPAPSTPAGWRSRRTPRRCRRLRQRASATALARFMAGALRSLKQLRLQPAVPARDWGDAAAALAGVLREAPARPAEAARSGKAAAEEPADIIRWIDEIDDAEM